MQKRSQRARDISRHKEKAETLEGVKEVSVIECREGTEFEIKERVGHILCAKMSEWKRMREMGVVETEFLYERRQNIVQTMFVF